MSKDTIRAWNEITSIRLSHQASCINNDAEPDNIIDFNLFNTEQQIVAGHAVKTIIALMMKAGSDYYTEIL